MKGDARVANAAKRKAEFEARIQREADNRTPPQPAPATTSSSSSGNATQGDSKVGNPPASAQGGGSQPSQPPGSSHGGVSAKGDEQMNASSHDPESDRLMRQIMREQQRKEDAEMRRMCRKRGGAPVEAHSRIS